ncbi:MAG: hypothetical protein FVQ83_07415 [Chloroflexi bacterium]|nr:hypothetical protein [Chloroflexota bacterium]
MEINKRKISLVWPVILIGLGIVFLLDNLGVVSWNVGLMLYRMWPLILVAFGLDILFGRRSGTAGVVSLVLIIAVFVGGVWLFNTYGENFSNELAIHQIDQAANEAADAKLEIDFEVGELVVGSLSSEGILAQGSIELPESQEFINEFQLDGDTANLRLASENLLNFPDWLGGSIFDSHSIDWEINLTENLPIDLEINTGVGFSVIDLENLSLTGLDIDTGVGETMVYLPSSGDFHATISGGVGEINIYIPEGTAILIRVSTGIGSVSVRGDFDQSGDVYVSESYSSDRDYIELIVSGGVGSINIRETDR